jgi:hypothetical protein
VSTESIAIPPERVPPVATEQASTSKSIAGVLLFLAGLCLIAMLSSMDEFDKDREHPTDGAEAAGEKAGAVIAVLLFPGIPAWFGWRSARNGMRATRAAKAAAGHTWQLSGKLLIASDATGAPRPDLSFKTNGRVRAMLLAVPKAQAHQHS